MIVEQDFLQGQRKPRLRPMPFWLRLGEVNVAVRWKSTSCWIPDARLYLPYKRGDLRFGLLLPPTRQRWSVWTRQAQSCTSRRQRNSLLFAISRSMPVLILFLRIHNCTRTLRVLRTCHPCKRPKSKQCIPGTSQFFENTVCTLNLELHGRRTSSSLRPRILSDPFEAPSDKPIV